MWLVKIVMEWQNIKSHGQSTIWLVHISHSDLIYCVNGTDQVHLHRKMRGYTPSKPSLPVVSWPLVANRKWCDKQEVSWCNYSESVCSGSCTVCAHKTDMCYCSLLNLFNHLSWYTSAWHITQLCMITTLAHCRELITDKHACKLAYMHTYMCITCTN